MSENKDTLAAGAPADFYSPPSPTNGAFTDIFFTCGHSFYSVKRKGREIFMQALRELLHQLNPIFFEVFFVVRLPAAGWRD